MAYGTEIIIQNCVLPYSAIHLMSNFDTAQNNKQRRKTNWKITNVYKTLNFYDRRDISNLQNLDLT